VESAITTRGPVTDEVISTRPASLFANQGVAACVSQKQHFKLSAKASSRISSVTGPRVVMADSTHYAAAKAGVNGFIRAAALELSPLRITVNGVEPGFIGKDRGRLSQAENRARIEHYIPAGHMGSAADIAHAMLYLASPGASFVTGQTIVVDGGATLPDSGFAMDELHGKGGGTA
jgi:3-oxoacyl-[acyl-carrier protein] reductase